jgi:hypothetical protein
LKKQFHSTQQNFDKVVGTLKDHKGMFGEGIVDLQTSWNLLAIQLTSTKKEFSQLGLEPRME